MVGNHELSEAVQRALLPSNLPDIPGWSVATLYQPAGGDLLVGGDFYDWFRRPDDTFALLVGDVAGKGSVAAATGMAIRKGLKAMCFAIPDIDEAVDRLESALEEELAATLVSFCYVELSGRPFVRLLSVGHPAPWLVHDGVAREVPLPHNRLFGLGRTLSNGPRSPAYELAVQPGDLLLLFSDGLTEARLPDGRQFGEGVLQEVLSEVEPGTRPWQLTLKLSQRLEQAVENLHDDLVVAVLGRD